MAASLHVPTQDLLFFVAIVAGTPGPLNLAIFAISLANRRGMGFGVVLRGAVAYGALFAATALNARRLSEFDARVFDALRCVDGGGGPGLAGLAYRGLRSERRARRG